MKKRTSRARKRGAAMIEAVIVVSTMLVFMGLISYTRQSYGMKLDMQAQTRANTLFFSSHGCEGAANGAAASTGGAVPGDNPAAGPAGKSGQQGASATASRSYNTASASLTQRASFQATWDKNARGQNNSIDLRKETFSREVHAASKVTCNEKKYDNQWTAWARFGADFAMNLGGASSLFGK